MREKFVVQTSLSKLMARYCAKAQYRAISELKLLHDYLSKIGLNPDCNKKSETSISKKNKSV